MLGQWIANRATRVALVACLVVGLTLVAPLLVGAESASSSPAESAATALGLGPCAGQTTGQLCVRYFNNKTLTGTPVLTQLETATPIRHDWGSGSPAAGIVNADGFSARWEGTFHVETGVFPDKTYTFIAVADDGVRVWVDDALIVDAWRDQAPTTYRVEVTLGQGYHNLKMEYYENQGRAVAKLGYWEQCHDCFVAEYYNNRTLSDLPVLVRFEPAIDHDWGTGSPGPGVNADGFSVRWTAHQFLTFPFGTPGPYLFSATTDDGMRAWIDGELILNSWEDQPPTSSRWPVDVAGDSHDVVVEYYEHAGGAVARIDWARVCDEGQAYAEYFANQSLEGPATIARCEALPIDHDWAGGSPGAGIPADHFSARWTAATHFETGVFGPGAGSYVVTADDGVRLRVDDKLVLDKWLNQPPTRYRVDVPLDQGYHLVTMEYYENAGGAVAKLSPLMGCPSTFRIEYFGNRYLTGSPASVECDPDGYNQVINRNFGSGGPGVSGVGADNFSIVWTGAFMFTPASYTFTATADDGVRVYLDNRLILDEWRDQAPTTFRKAVWVPGGYHTIRMEYYERGGGSVARLSWPRTYRSTITVDDTSAGFRKGGSYWRESTIGYAGHAWWTYVNGSSVDSWGEWSADLQGGAYEVFVWVPRANASAARAPYTVTHLGGSTTRYVSQASYDDQWVSIGTFEFASAGTPRVRLTDATGEAINSRAIAFDAVRFVPR